MPITSHDLSLASWLSATLSPLLISLSLSPSPLPPPALRQKKRKSPAPAGLLPPEPAADAFLGLCGLLLELEVGLVDGVHDLAAGAVLGLFEHLLALRYAVLACGGGVLDLPIYKSLGGVLSFADGGVYFAADAGESLFDGGLGLFAAAGELVADCG